MVVSAAASRGRPGHLATNQWCIGRNITTKSAARNSGRANPAITLKNNAATTIRIATSTTNDTFRDMAGPPWFGWNSTRAYSSKLALDLEHLY